MNDPLTGRTVVLVINSPEIRELVRRILEPQGYTVLGMTTAQAARLKAPDARELAGTLYAVIAYDIADVPEQFRDLIVFYSAGTADPKYTRSRPLARPF